MEIDFLTNFDDKYPSHGLQNNNNRSGNMFVPTFYIVGKNVTLTAKHIKGHHVKILNLNCKYLDQPSLKVSQTGYLILSNYRNDFEGPGMEEHGNLFE